MGKSIRLRKWSELTRSYLMTGIVFGVVALIVLERTAYNTSLSRAEAVVPVSSDATGPQVPVPAPQKPQPLPPVRTKPPTLEDPWSFFHPVWKRKSAWPQENDRATLPDKSEAAAEQIRRLVYDPENRVDGEFKVPAYLRERVIFWMEVYSRHNSRVRIVHDRNNLSAIFGTIDFRSIYRAETSNAAAEAKANQIEKKILKGLKQRFEEAIGIQDYHLLSADEKSQIQSLLSSLGAYGKKETETLVENIRTQTGQSDMFLLAVYRSRELLPHIESVFKQQNLPGSLGHIPFVESSFNWKAHSKDGAVGIWQFMPETARQMIHKQEQKLWADPLRQTKSAAKMLKIYRSLLPDWGITVTSYNSGVGRLRRIVQKYKIKDVEGLLQLPASEGLGFAGKNFYAEFLAATLVEAYKNELFARWLEPADASLVFRGETPFPQAYCDM